MEDVQEEEIEEATIEENTEVVDSETVDVFSKTKYNYSPLGYVETETEYVVNTDKIASVENIEYYAMGRVFESEENGIKTMAVYLSDSTMESGILYLYDAWSHLTDIYHVEGKQVLSLHHYTYDGNGNVLSESVSKEIKTVFNSLCEIDS